VAVADEIATHAAKPTKPRLRIAAVLGLTRNGSSEAIGAAIRIAIMLLFTELVLVGMLWLACSSRIPRFILHRKMMKVFEPDWKKHLFPVKRFRQGMRICVWAVPFRSELIGAG
jgi:hypothetical protein